MTEKHQEVSHVLADKWNRRLRTGCVDNRMQKGRPPKISERVKKISNVVREDRRQTVQDVAGIVGINKFPVQSVIC